MLESIGTGDCCIHDAVNDNNGYDHNVCARMGTWRVCRDNTSIFGALPRSRSKREGLMNTCDLKSRSMADVITT